MKLQTHVTEYVSRPPLVVFEAAVASENMSRLLMRFGPIPGVVRVELPAGKQLTAGITRQIFMTDGTTMHEEVIEVLPPGEASAGRHEYRWQHAPAPPFSLLIKGAHALWTFHAEREGTRVHWHYTFALTSPLAYVLAAPAIALFRRWMSRALGRLRDLK